MELRLAVAVVDRASPASAVTAGEVDVVASVEPDHTVGELTAALADHLGVGDGHEWLLTRPSTGEEFDGGERLGGLGLVTGDTVALGRHGDRPGGDAWPGGGADPPSRSARRPPGSAAWWIEVAGGPDVGRRHRLAPGATVRIGRDRRAELTLRDPALGRVAVTIRIGADDVVTVVPPPEADVALDGRPVATPVPWHPGQALRCSSTMLELRRRTTALVVDEATTPTVAVHPTADHAPGPEPGAFGLEGGVPTEPEPSSFAYLAAAMPLVMGLALAVMFSPRFLLFAVFSPLVAVGGHLDQRRRVRRRQRRLAERFDRALDHLVRRATEALADERRRRLAHAPDLAELAHRIERRDRRLWGRSPGVGRSPLRCGTGTVTPLVAVEAPTGGDEVLRALADERLAPLRRLVDVPITVDLATEVAISLVGPSTITSPLATALVVQAAAHHRPSELVIAAALGPGHGATHWLPWLPHTRAAAEVLGVAPLASSPAAADGLLRAVAELGRARAASRRSRVGGEAGLGRPSPALVPRVLLVVDGALAAGIATAAAGVGTLGREAGATLLWLAPTADGVPPNTSVRLDCPGRASRRPARLHRLGPGSADTDDVVEFTPDGLEVDVARPLALGLAPLIDASGPERATSLPAVATLADLLGPPPRWRASVAAAWRRPRGPTLAAPIGVGADGPMMIDLVADGPHCLIGGTSGSGKSELTRSLVASLLAHHPPGRLNVLFVDYKGGATGEAFVTAPHTVGCVTNLDGGLAQRVLVSLRAELGRRMDLLRGRAKDLYDLARIDPDGTPPALVIVIDEFATLVVEVPAFMAGIIDLAQRGRSLGIHLVLATQRPAAAVSDDILANTNLRICLRTVDGAESTSVLGVADAAAIPPTAKGRALVRRGPGAPTPFQAAWSTAPPPSDGGRAAIAVRPLIAPPLTSPPTVGGGRSPAAGGSRRPAGGRPPTAQLDELLTAITAVSASQACPAARPPWLPELPHRVAIDGVTGLATSPPAGPGIDIGLVDRPERQARSVARLDLAAVGGLVIAGAGGSGKTTALETVAEAAARSAKPPVLFALDASSRRLLALAHRPCCAAAASGDDLEAVTRLIVVLEREIAARRRGRVADRRPLLLLLDDYGALTELFEVAGAPTGQHRWLERLNRSIVDGRQVGLATALTVDRRAAVRAVVWSALAARLVLRCIDDAAYRDLGVDPALLGPQPPPGRGILDGHVTQITTAPPADECAPPTRAASSSPSVGTAAGLARAAPAPERLVVPALPVDLAPVDPAPPLAVPPAPFGPSLPIRLGVVDLTAAPDPLHLDLALDDVAVLGPPRSGRSTTLAAVARQVAVAGRRVVACGPRRSPLAAVPAVDRWFTLDGTAAALDGLAELIENHHGDLPPVLMIDGADRLDDPALAPASARIAAVGLPLVAAATSLRGFGTDPLWLQARRARTLILLGPPSPIEVQEAAGVAFAVRPGIRPTPGRAVAVVEGRPLLVQITNGLTSDGNGPALDEGAAPSSAPAVHGSADEAADVTVDQRPNSSTNSSKESAMVNQVTVVRGHPSKRCVRTGGGSTA